MANRRCQVSVYTKSDQFPVDPPTFQTTHNTAVQGLQEAVKHLNYTLPAEKFDELARTLETNDSVSLGQSFPYLGVEVVMYDPANPPAPPGQVVHIVREGSAPCENVVCAAFSTYERAEAWIKLAAKNMGVDEDMLFIDSQVLNMATPNIY